MIGIWTSFRSLRDSKPAYDPPTLPLFSPKVEKKLAEKVLGTITDASRFWQEQVRSESVIPVFFYTEKDTAWYQSELLKLGLNKTEVAGKIRQYKDEISRNGSRSNMAGMNRYRGITWMEFMIGTQRKSIDLNSVTVGPHEWTHFAQFQVLGSGLGYAPCWFMEGSAEFYGMMLGAMNKSTLVSMRKRQLSERYPRNFSGMKIEVTQGWEEYLEQNGPKVTNPRYDEDCGINGTYPVGAAATEYLLLLKGHQGILDFMDEIGGSRDFKSAFRIVYGMSWSEGKKQIANYIRAITSQNQTG